MNLSGVSTAVIKTASGNNVTWASNGSGYEFNMRVYPDANDDVIDLDEGTIATLQFMVKEIDDSARIITGNISSAISFYPPTKENIEAIETGSNMIAVSATGKITALERGEKQHTGVLTMPMAGGRNYAIDLIIDNNQSLYQRANNKPTSHFHFSVNSIVNVHGVLRVGDHGTATIETSHIYPIRESSEITHVHVVTTQHKTRELSANRNKNPFGGALKKVKYNVQEKTEERDVTKETAAE